MAALDVLPGGSASGIHLLTHCTIMKEVFDKTKVTLNYYLKNMALRDERGRVMRGYGIRAVREAIKAGRVLTEGGLIIVESLKNL